MTPDLQIEFTDSYLDLWLRHAEGVGELGPFWAGQVFGLLEGLLQREDLLAREGWPEA